MNRPSKEVIDELCKGLADQGKLIEAGWRSLQLSVIELGASEIQQNEMRLAFYAGAQHLFASIMGLLDPGEEPTEKDLERMSLIQAELKAWSDKITLHAMRGPRQ